MNLIQLPNTRTCPFQGIVDSGRHLIKHVACSLKLPPFKRAINLFRSVENPHRCSFNSELFYPEDQWQHSKAWRGLLVDRRRFGSPNCPGPEQPNRIVLSLYIFSIFYLFFTSIKII